jgi:hypothetical protein
MSLIGNTNQGMGVHGPLNISEVESDEGVTFITLN